VKAGTLKSGAGRSTPHPRRTYRRWIGIEDRPDDNAIGTLVLTASGRRRSVLAEAEKSEQSQCWWMAYAACQTKGRKQWL